MVTGAGAESWRQALAEDGWSRQLTTLEGWRKFTAAGSRPPQLPDARQWAAMGEAEQELFDEYRLDYHTRLAAAATLTLRQVVTTGRRLTLLNRHAISARRGMLLSGAAGTGKATAGRFTLIPHPGVPAHRRMAGPGRHVRDALRLHRHQPATLAALHEYLHRRTGGMIGSLSHLIRGAAIEAILDGSEQVTRKPLDTIDVDHAAQNNTARRPRRRA